MSLRDTEPVISLWRPAPRPTWLTPTITMSLMGIRQPAKEPGRIAAPFVVGPTDRVEPHRGLNGLPLSGESQSASLLPISLVGVDGVVGQSDRVHYVKLRLKTSSKVRCHL